MQTLRFKRLLSLLAAATFLFAALAFSAHGYNGQGLAHNSAHCDLCLQFNGTAGTPAVAAVAGKPVLSLRQAIVPFQPVFSFERNVDSRLPRGPPVIDLI